jgi:predicted nucleic acid-binding protein
LNKAILDTDIFSEIIKGVNQTVAAHAKTYRRAFGHYTVAAVNVMEIVQGYQQKQATRQHQRQHRSFPTRAAAWLSPHSCQLANVTHARINLAFRRARREGRLPTSLLRSAVRSDPPREGWRCCDLRCSTGLRHPPGDRDLVTVW